jgi:hypothetical protein
MRTINTYPTSARVPTAVLATGTLVAAAPEPPLANPIDGRLVIVVVGPEPANDVDGPKPIAILEAATLPVADVASVETVILRKILVTPVTPLQRAL